MRVLFVVILFFAFNLNAQTNSDYEKAKSAFDIGKLDDAYIHLKNSLDDDHSHLPSKILMGKILAISFYYDDAIVEFDEAIKAGADRNLVIEYYANALLIEKRYDDVAILSDKGLSPKNKAFLKTIQAKAFNALGDSDKAATFFKDAIKLDATNPNISTSYARFLAQTDKLDEAMAQINHSLALDDADAEALRTKANLYKYMGQFDSYYATLEKAIAIDSDQPLVLRDLISAYMSKDQYGEAKILLERVLATAPDAPMAKFLYSWVSTRLGDTETANQTLEELVNYLSLIDDEAMQNADGLVYITGLANYAAGNVEAASVALNKYLSKQPNDLNASILLSEIYVQDGNFASAVRLLERFKDLALEDLNFGSKLCDLYIQAKANHKCNWLILQMSEEHESKPAFIALKAKSLAARGKPAEALNTLSKIPNNSETVILNRALLSIESNQFDLALEEIERLLALEKDNNDFKNLLAGVYIKQGKVAQAETILQSILEKNQMHYSAKFNLASVKFKQSQFKEALDLTSSLLVERSAQINVMLLQARILRKLKRNDEALELITNILTLDNAYISAKLELSDIYIELNEFDSALNILNQLIKDDFLNATYLRKRAEVFIAKQDYTSAKKDLAVLFSTYAKQAGSLFQLAFLQREARDMEGAIKSIETAIEIAPGDYSLQRERSRLLLQTNQISAAEEQINKLKETFDLSADTLLLMGDLAIEKQEPEIAAKHYNEAVKKDNLFTQALTKRYHLAQLGYATDSFVTLYESILKDDSSSDYARNLLADYYLKNKMNDKAKVHYTAIVKHNSYANMPLVMNNLANIYLSEGNFKSAHELAQKAYSTMPNNQALLDTLGWSLAKLKKYDEALNYLRQSYSMNTADPAVRYHLGYVLNKLGRTKDAKAELVNLLEQFGEFDERVKAQKLLEEL